MVLDRILAALRSAGRDPGNLTAGDLSAADEFHLRGRRAAADLAALARLEAGMCVLDLGSGIGGPARLLASTAGCSVTGIDANLDYSVAAHALSRLTRLDTLTRFCCADATRLPFRDRTFDLAWTQHVQMAIADKASFYGEAGRVLKPGARFAFHDICSASGEPAIYPTPWAADASTSYLIAPEVLRALLDRSGFRIVEWRDTTAVDRDWHLANLRRQRDTLPELGVHLLIESEAREKLTNLGRNLEEGRLSVYFGVAERLY